MAKPYSVHCRKGCAFYLRIMVIPFICLEGGKKVKAELLFCVYNKSITTATTVMSQTLHQGPDSVSEEGRAA